MGDDNKVTLMEEMRVLAGVQPGGVQGIGLEEAVGVSHRMKGGNVVTTPSDVLKAILKAGGKGVQVDTDFRATLDVNAPNVLSITSGYSTSGSSGPYPTSGDYHSIAFGALNPATNNTSTIKRIVFPSGVYYKAHTKSWWYDERRQGMPGHKDPERVKKAIDEVVKQGRAFISKYVKAAKKSEAKGSAGLLAQAQEINQRLNLRIPNSALKKLCAELKS